VHSINKAWEQFRLVGAVSAMTSIERFERDSKADSARANDVLYLEILKFNIRGPLLFDHLGVHFGGLLRFFLTFRTGNDHLA
jgi:hypothetical protein